MAFDPNNRIVFRAQEVDYGTVLELSVQLPGGLSRGYRLPGKILAKDTVINPGVECLPPEGCALALEALARWIRKESKK